MEAVGAGEDASVAIGPPIPNTSQEGRQGVTAFFALRSHVTTAELHLLLPLGKEKKKVSSHLSGLLSEQAPSKPGAGRGWRSWGHSRLLSSDSRNPEIVHVKDCSIL